VAEDGSGRPGSRSFKHLAGGTLVGDDGMTVEA
jgi:hypothetical protein